MIPLPEAQARVMANITTLGVVSVPISESRGHVLAEPVDCDENIPPFSNTAMDGFAVRAADTVGASPDQPNSLTLAGTIAAGSVAARPLEAGEAMRIMTGAPMPDGADAVIMVELTEATEVAVQALAEVRVGNHIRPPGDDLRAGTRVFEAGTVISPAHIGMLATVGLENVNVYRRPRVGVFSTGDELVVGPEALGPGQIRDSNRPTLLALVEEAGLEAVDLGWLPDDEATIENALTEAAGSCDALITSGGVSMGDFDFVKVVLKRLGDLNWMQVAIKPAKPLAFGYLAPRPDTPGGLGTPIFGLPGNPVSSAVSFELFARPALLSMMGRRDNQRTTVWALADEPLERAPDEKTHFQRVIVNDGGDGAPRVRSAGGQGSHQLSALAYANALAVLPNGSGAAVGERVKVMLL